MPDPHTVTRRAQLHRAAVQLVCCSLLQSTPDRRHLLSCTRTATVHSRDTPNSLCLAKCKTQQLLTTYYANLHAKVHKFAQHFTTGCDITMIVICTLGMFHTRSHDEHSSTELQCNWCASRLQSTHDWRHLISCIRTATVNSRDTVHLL